jgi:hypothetical protein
MPRRGPSGPGWQGPPWNGHGGPTILREEVSMNRRELLAALAATAALGTITLVVRNWFTGDTTRDALDDAWSEARRSRRPLLVLVIPSADTEKWLRGDLFGQFFGFATDAQVAPLHSCGIACATVDDIRHVVGADVQGEPLMVLVTPGKSARVNALDGAVAPDPPLPTALTDAAFARWQSECAKASDARIATVAGLIAGALGPPAVPERAAATAVRAGVSRRAPPGAHWAKASGCGIEVEDIPPDPRTAGVMCGMGSVPVRCARFLYFFTTPTRAEMGLRQLRQRSADVVDCFR